MSNSNARSMNTPTAANPKVPLSSQLSYSAIRFLQHFAGQKFGKTGSMKTFIDDLYQIHEQSLLRHYAGTPDGRYTDIEEVESISPQDFRDNYLVPERKVVFSEFPAGSDSSPIVLSRC
jgi:hypothetical protein